ncbi:MAG: hypothetical protein BWZ00_01837 [Bacteroidetes bacterium ADurb.BinA174]|nr:MAG: hypothetical protein BWZ00_01837 [Bacteroidetes bacterium ADurb.BinA174]
MIRVMMSRKSENAFCNVLPLMSESPIPMQNDKISADITSMMGGIPMLKNDSTALSSILRTASASIPPVIMFGKTAWHEK